MAELGIIAPQGIARVADLMAVLSGEDTTNLPALAVRDPPDHPVNAAVETGRGAK
jgi:hypothetical protein